MRRLLLFFGFYASHARIATFAFRSWTCGECAPRSMCGGVIANLFVERERASAMALGIQLGPLMGAFHNVQLGLKLKRLARSLSRAYGISATSVSLPYH